MIDYLCAAGAIGSVAYGIRWIWRLIDAQVDAKFASIQARADELLEDAHLSIWEHEMNQ